MLETPLSSMIWRSEILVANALKDPQGPPTGLIRTIGKSAKTGGVFLFWLWLASCNVAWHGLSMLSSSLNTHFQVVDPLLLL
jgi:hypothetical protein